MTIASIGPCRGVTWPHLAVLAALAAGPALGQTAGGDAAPAAPVGREMLAKGTVFRALGPEVKGPSGTTVALLVNVLVDEQGAPRAAVLDYGGFLGVGKRRIAVAWPMLRFGAQGIVLALSRDQLKAFPEFRDGEDIAIATLPTEGTPDPQAAAQPGTPDPAPPAPAAEPAPPAELAPPVAEPPATESPAAAPPVATAPSAAVAPSEPPAQAPAEPAPASPPVPAGPPPAGGTPPGDGRPAVPPTVTRPE